MLFNPLFLQVINNQESISTKTQKLSNPSYLFSDIIKVSVENELKNSMGSFGAQKVNFLGGSNELMDKQMINIPLELKSSNIFNSSVENVIEQLINQISPNTSLESLQKTPSPENIDSIGNNSSKMLFDQSKIHELITKLINNKEFNGKANLVIDRQKLMQDNYSSALDEITKNDITPEMLLNLLKMGNTISLESTPADKNLGLLITLIEHNEGETNLSENSGEISEPSKNGVKHTISDPGNNSAIDNVLSNLQNINLSGSVTYEIKINVIGQSDNINQNNNYLLSGVSALVEPENKIKVDIVLKESSEISNNNNELNKLTQLSPPEELFASASNNSSELSKVSSSFSNVLASDAQKLKNISQNSESVNINSTTPVKNILTTSANVDDIGNVQKETQKLNLTAENKTGNKNNPENPGILTSTKENVNSDADKTQLKINNPINVKTSENSFTYNKLSDSVKVEHTKSTLTNNITSEVKSETKGNSAEQAANQTRNTESASALFSSKTTNPNNAPETGKNITSKPVDFFTKNTGNQAEIKEIKFEQTKTFEHSSIINSQNKAPEAKTATDGTKTNQVIQDNKPENSLTYNETGIKENKSEIKIENPEIISKQQVSEEAKTSVAENSASLKGQKEILNNKEMHTNGKEANNSVNKENINQETRVENKNKENSNKTEIENNNQKISAEISGSNEREKVEHQFVNDASSQSRKTEKPEIKNSNEAEAKPELNNNTKVNENTSENSTSENNNKGNTFSDSGKNSEENKGSREGKSANEVNLEKTFEASSKEKAGLEKGHYTDSARVVKAAELAKEISRHIQARDKSTLYLKIDPEHLGTVRIAVDIIDNIVRANIEVENESAQKLIENNLNQLYNNLNQNGVQLNSLNISLSNFEQKHNKAYAPKKKAFGFEEDGDVDENSKTAREKSLGYNTYEYLV